jgi:hypothetical protein
MHTHKLHLIRVISHIWRGIYPGHNIPSRHVVTDVGGGVVLDGEYFGADDFGLTVFGGFIVEAVVFVWGVRNVVEHEFAALFAESLLGHGRGFCAALACLLLDVGQGATPVDDLVVCDVDAVRLVVELLGGG